MQITDKIVETLHLPLKGELRMIGAVKYYDAKRGVGEIRRDDGGNVFVHVSQLERAGLTSLAAGDLVSFDVQTDQATHRTFAVNLALP